MELLSEDGYKEVGADAGKLLWAAKQKKPDLSFDTCQLISNLKSVAIAD